MPDEEEGPLERMEQSLRRAPLPPRHDLQTQLDGGPLGKPDLLEVVVTNVWPDPGAQSQTQLQQSRQRQRAQTKAEAHQETITGIAKLR